MNNPNNGPQAARDDDIVQRLRDNADLDEAEHDNVRVAQLERDAADEIERLRGELSRLRTSIADEAVTNEMIQAGAKAAREYFEAYGGNSPRVIYKAMRAARV